MGKKAARTLLWLLDMESRSAYIELNDLRHIIYKNFDETDFRRLGYNFGLMLREGTNF